MQRQPDDDSFYTALVRERFDRLHITPRARQCGKWRGDDSVFV